MNKSVFGNEYIIKIKRAFKHIMVIINRSSYYSAMYSDRHSNNNTRINQTTFLGELRRSAYRASAVLKIHGDGKGGASEPPFKGLPSSLSECIEKRVSEESPSSCAASSTDSRLFSAYTPTWSPVSYLLNTEKGSTKFCSRL
jgi:hypothetical protein